MSKVLKAIADYYLNEFEQDVDEDERASGQFGLAYTELYDEGDGFHTMQVSLDLNRKAITFAVDDEVFYTWFFEDENDIVATIEGYDFQAWYGETLDLYEWKTGIELH